MKEVSCRDMGVNCAFVAKGNTDEEVKKAVWAHAEKSHADMVKTMTPDKKKEMEMKLDTLLKRPTAAPAKK